MPVRLWARAACALFVLGLAASTLGGCSKQEEPGASSGYYTGPMKPKGTVGGGGDPTAETGTAAPAQGGR